MSDLSSPRYNANGAYRPQIHSQRSKTEAYDVEDLKSDYSKALNHIETLKLEQTSLKNALRVALCEANSDYSKDLNSHRQSYHSTESFVNPKAMEKRLQELEQENRELKALLEANSKKIAKFQKEQKDYLEKVIENEKLHAKIDELNTELNTLNKEFCIITDKLLQVEVKNSDLLSQSIRYNQEPSSSTDRTSVLKYANYIYQLISSVDKNHFSFCCFEERFSKGQEFFNLIKSNDMSSLVLKAFKYITDLLINVNSQYFSNSVPNSAIHPTSPEKSIRYNNSQAGSQDPSYFTEYLPDQNFIQRSETPQNYDMSDFDDTPTPNIVSRLMERIGQRENERSGILKNDDTRSPLRNSGNKLHSLDSSLFGKFNSASKIEDKSMRSIENSPKKVQFKVNEDNKYGVETEILEYTGMEDSRPTSREDSRIEEESEQDEDLVARYKRELRERCKVIKEEKVENKPKQQKMGFKEIKEASYEEPEENSVNYSEPSKMHKEVSVLEVLSQSSSASKLKNFLKTTKDEKDSSVIDEKEYAGISQRKGAHHSRQNYSEASSNSESWRIDPKLRDYKVSNERANKNTLRAREKTTSLTRESSGSRFTPVISPRMKSPKNNMTYQQINTARKTRATMEDDRSLKRQAKQNTSTSSDARKMEYVTYSVAFSKNEMKSKCSPSPSGRVMSVRDIPKKKRVDSYPKQTYDVIKGQELVKPKTK